MIVSKGVTLLKLLNRTGTIKNVRNMAGHSWYYRAGVKNHSKATLYCSHAAGALMWWWVLWHLWHEHEHITGEFPFPDPSKWSDEELGIPE